MENNNLIKIIAGLGLILFLGMGLSNLISGNDHLDHQENIEELSDESSDSGLDSSNSNENQVTFNNKLKAQKKSTLAKFKSKFKKSQKNISLQKQTGNFTPQQQTNSHNFHDNSNKKSLNEKTSDTKKKAAKKENTPNKTGQVLKKQDCEKFDESQEDAYYACLENNARIDRQKKAALAKARARRAKQIENAEKSAQEAEQGENNKSAERNDADTEEDLNGGNDSIVGEIREEIPNPNNNNNNPNENDKTPPYEKIKASLDRANGATGEDKVSLLKTISTEMIQAYNDKKLSNNHFFELLETYYLKAGQQNIQTIGLELVLEVTSEQAFIYAIDLLERKDLALSDEDQLNYLEAIKTKYAQDKNLSLLSSLLNSLPLPEGDSEWTERQPLSVTLSILTKLMNDKLSTLRTGNDVTALTEVEIARETAKLKKEFVALKPRLQTTQQMVASLIGITSEFPLVKTEAESVNNQIVELISEINSKFIESNPALPDADPDRLVPTGKPNFLVGER